MSIFVGPHHTDDTYRFEAVDEADGDQERVKEAIYSGIDPLMVHSFPEIYGENNGTGVRVLILEPDGVPPMPNAPESNFEYNDSGDFFHGLGIASILYDAARGADVFGRVFQSSPDAYREIRTITPRVVCMAMGYGEGHFLQTFDDRNFLHMLRLCKDVLFVMSAGNDASGDGFLRGNTRFGSDNVIMCVAVDVRNVIRQDAITPDKGGVMETTVAVMGSDVEVVLPNHETYMMGGSSPAAPVVTGLAAIIISAHPTFTVPQVMECILQSTRRTFFQPDDSGGGTWVCATADEARRRAAVGVKTVVFDPNTYGRGILDAERAILYANLLSAGQTNRFEHEASEKETKAKHVIRGAMVRRKFIIDHKTWKDPHNGTRHPVRKDPATGRLVFV